MNTTIRSFLVLATAVTFALSPVLLGGFGGYDTTAFPVPMADPPMQPEGWAFSIWGPIYLWLIAMTAFGAFKRRDDPGWDVTRVPLAISLAIGTIWIAAAERSPILATGLIWLMLATAIVALVRTPRRDRLLLRAPVALYAGWLTAASAVSLGLIAAGHGVLGLAPDAWTFVTLSLTLLIAVPTILLRPTIPYVLAIVWALAGIAAGIPPIFLLAYAVVGAGALLFLLATQARRILAPNPPKA